MKFNNLGIAIATGLEIIASTDLMAWRVCVFGMRERVMTFPNQEKNQH